MALLIQMGLWAAAARENPEEAAALLSLREEDQQAK